MKTSSREIYNLEVLILAIFTADSNKVAGVLFTYDSTGIPERIINEDRYFYLVKAKLWI